MSRSKFMVRAAAGSSTANFKKVNSQPPVDDSVNICNQDQDYLSTVPVSVQLSVGCLNVVAL